MLKKTAILFFILLISTFAIAELQPISVEREIAGSVKAGETIQVKLHLKFIGEKPSGMIITEFPPQGWEITSSIPSGSKFSDHTSWLIYGNEVKDSTIVYELKAPASLKEAVLLNGIWETLTANGFITGDLAVNLTPEKRETPTPTASPQTTSADNTLFYSGIGIIVIIIIVAAAAVLSSRKKKK